MQAEYRRLLLKLEWKLKVKEANAVQARRQKLNNLCVDIYSSKVIEDNDMYESRFVQFKENIMGRVGKNKNGQNTR